MNIIVCVKRVPETAEADISIDKDGKGVVEKDLVFAINEWDNYAIEEAILLKEKLGGSVTALTLGPPESDEVLRRCLAMGADSAIRLTDAAFDGSDALATARILSQAIKGVGNFDLILAGAQAGDDGCGLVGVAMAQLLGIPHATLVTALAIEGKTATVRRELEDGLAETLKIELPALLGVQTGINEPRYVSIMGIRKARTKEIKVLGLADIGLKAEETGAAGSRTKIDEMFVPRIEKMAEIVKGETSEEVSANLVEILAKKGLI